MPTPRRDFLAILVPSRGQVRVEWAAMLTRLSFPTGVAHTLLYAPDTSTSALPLDEKRTALVEYALAFDHPQFGRPTLLAFLGDDLLPPPEAFARLYYRLEAPAPDGSPVEVVSGWYRGKDAPHVPVVLGEDEQVVAPPLTGEGLTRVFCAGCDLLLLRASVLARLTKPWFLTTDLDLVADEPVDTFAYTETEDVFFARRLRAAGVAWWVDWTVGAAHLRLSTGEATRPVVGPICLPA